MKTRVLILAAILTLGLTTGASALPVTFTDSSGDKSASATFDVLGDQLLVKLTNTSTADPRYPTDILTGLVFSIPDNPLLTRESATLAAGSTVIHGPTPSTDPGNNVGGEWAYSNNLTGTPFAGQSAIYSAGYFPGNDRFPGTNLQGPASVDGVQYGITTSFDTLANDNGGLDDRGLIQNSVDFVLGGLAEGFDINSISNVSFLYGTSLDENIPVVPEPATYLLLAIGLAGLAFYRNRCFNV